MDFQDLLRRHGGDDEGAAAAAPPASDVAPSYFTHPAYPDWILAHIVIMVLAWVFVLPMAVMLSISRSKIPALTAQVVFVATNAVGLLCGTVYNHSTPDLYPNNSHHKFGWVLTWLVTAQAVVGLLRAYASKSSPQPAQKAEMAQAKPMRPPHLQRGSDASSRFSRDSGYGIELESPREFSPSAPDVESRRTEPAPEDDNDVEERQGLLGRNNKLDRYLVEKLRGAGPSRVMRVLDLAYSIVDRSSLILGFVALATGVVTYGGFFVGHAVFSGLAHFIKGGIFFWYGLYTLGRAMGAFAEFGWAWNVKPPTHQLGSRTARVPSAEFVESLLIFLYGSTNVFLERLGSDPGWSATELEHVSISIMFFGGGLCGMLLESRRIRDSLNAVIVGEPHAAPEFGQSTPYDSGWHEPRHYGFSLNPLPALIIMLLGLMMSGHHQTSMVSSMLHKQWGNLFLAGSLFRGLTYVLTYLSPPTSFLPSRPPSEIVVAFCLIAGGLLFMGSNSDFVLGMEHYGLDAMFLFTVIMGLTAFLMAWEIVVLAIKSWAVRRERARAYR